jgi:hypothetical protein
MDEAAGSIPATSTNFPKQSDLFQDFGGETGKSIVVNCVGNFNRIAANFTIFHVRLTANGKIQHHRNFFAAIRAEKVMLHGISVFVRGGARKSNPRRRETIPRR